MLAMEDNIGTIELHIISRKMGCGIKIGEGISYTFLDLFYKVGEVIFDNFQTEYFLEIETLSVNPFII